MKIQKIIISIVIMYILHLIVANWPLIKQLISGNIQSEFIFLDFKLLTMCFLVFLSQIVQFTNKEKK